LPVHYDVDGAVVTVTIDRPQARNAVDSTTAAELADSFRRFDKDDELRVAVLTGAGGNFCAGFDLKEIAAGRNRKRLIAAPGRRRGGPMGPTRMLLAKPVIAAVEGYAVAGGLELALWCDLRVAGRTATFGVFNRRFGVPLIDGGTIRLPRLVGQGRALDLVLTGRPVPAVEAFQIGLIERIVPPGHAVEHAQALARALAETPQRAMQADRRSVLAQWSLSLSEALNAEFRGGVRVIASGESQAGARRFTQGQGRHGQT
jgi:enoyl-CoA hydratase